jgi:DNA-directed RNA polymerase subunit RPC12/RpoP
MSNQTETDRAKTDARTGRLDLIACEGCGRRFATDDGPGMIAAIKGPCPDCGARFELIEAPPAPRRL